MNRSLAAPRLINCQHFTVFLFLPDPFFTSLSQIPCSLNGHVYEWANVLLQKYTPQKS